MHTTDHDPTALLGKPLPNPSPWESLALHARWLADYADKCAQAAPEILAPVGDEDALAELDDRALNVRSIAAACRRHTYRQLRDNGTSVEDIAEAWGVSISAIYKVLGGPPRAKR